MRKFKTLSPEIYFYLTFGTAIFLICLLFPTKDGSYFPVFLGSFTLTAFVLLSSQNAYFILLNDEKMIIKNHFLFWVNKSISINKITKLIVGKEEKSGNYLRFWVEDFGERKYFVSIDETDLGIIAAFFKERNIESLNVI